MCFSWVHISDRNKNSLLGNSVFTSTLFPNTKLSVGVFFVEEGVDWTRHAESRLWSVPKEQGYPTSPTGSSKSVFKAIVWGLKLAAQGTALHPEKTQYKICELPNQKALIICRNMSQTSHHVYGLQMEVNAFCRPPAGGVTHSPLQQLAACSTGGSWSGDWCSQKACL